MNNTNSFLISILISLFFCTSCTSDTISPQVVNITPLYNLEIKKPVNHLVDIINPNIFDNYEGLDTYGTGTWRNNPNWSRVKVIFDIPPHHLIETFKSACNLNLSNPSKIIYGGKFDNQYCISYVVEDRSGPESLYISLGYSSQVVFLKGNLIIQIIETSSNKDVWFKDQVIKFLAEELSK